jgi:hypothetical protein
MRLHSLYSVTEHASAIYVDLALLCDDAALDIGSGPEVVVHGTPRRLGVCAIIACAILSTHEARRSPGELDVDHVSLIHCRLDGVERAVFGELNGHAIGEEGVLLLVEAVVAERVGSPQAGLLVVLVEQAETELDRHTHTTLYCQQSAP